MSEVFFFFRLLTWRKQEDVDGTPLMVCELLEGGSLDQVLYRRKNQQPLNEDQRRSIALGVARALNFLHTRSPPLLHRDVKPENVLLDSALQRVCLGDLGLARVKVLALFSSIITNIHNHCLGLRICSFSGWDHNVYGA